MATRSSRNNVLAGVFVLLCVALGMGVIVALSDLGERLTPMTRYYVHFSLVDGAEGLRPGSPVKVGGQPVGRVTGWRFAKQDDQPIGIDVEVQVHADLALHQDAAVFLVLPLLGTASQINIPDVGSGQRLQPGQTVRGSLAPPAFLAQAGFGDEQRRQLQEVIRNFAHTSEKVDRLVDTFSTEIEPAIGQVRAALADVQAITGDARETWPAWRDRVDSTLVRIEETGGRLGGVVDAFEDGVAQVRAMVDENRPLVENTLRNVEELSFRARTEGWDRLRDMLERGQRGMDDLAFSANRVSALVAEATPELRLMIANFRLASDQLRLTAAEVRSAPWKLLSRPTGRRELETEALYDAARQYAIAVADLRAASASLESVTAAAERIDHPTALDRAQMDRLLAELEQAFGRYQAAEQEFLSRLIGPPRR